MNEQGFKEWLESKNLTENSIATRMSAVRRIERILPELGIDQTNLDDAFEHDSLRSTKAALIKLKADAEQGGQDYRKLLPDSDTPIPRLENFIAALGNYRTYREGLSEIHETAAQRIRQHVLDNYIFPARERGDQYVSVPVRDVHDALSMSQAWANVCQAVAGPKFQILANVAPPSREGAEASPATVFRFDLHASPFSMDTVERELVRRFGSPVHSTQKILAFQFSDRSEIALDRERSAAQLWIEATRSVPERFRPTLYEPKQSRHSGLPPRLTHLPGSGREPRPVAMVRVGSMSEMADLLDWSASQSEDLDHRKLDHLKLLFLARYTDFEPTGFAATDGAYYTEERSYKDVLIDRTREALANQANEDDATLGGRLLDILTGNSGAPSNLLGWRTDDRMKVLRVRHPGLLEREAGRLARADDIDAAISGFASAVWPILAEGQASKPYSESRSIPTMLAALVHPTSAYGINTDPVYRLARTLTGEPILGYNPLTSKGYADVLTLVERVRSVMTSDWGWAPRDLWDVQGFVWAVHRADQPKLSDEAEETGSMNSPTQPTNLILYGPPGTGKTYATAREAVRLCKGTAPVERSELMSEYARLAASGQIEFVTFHQSYSYEEFVEGLRPNQGDENSPGFHLSPELGAFRRIARRAETSTGPGTSDFKIGNRQVFKMSIGAAADPDDAYLFDEALAGGYTLLGYGNIDWSDTSFESRDAIIGAWKKVGSTEEERTSSAMSGRVQCPHTFRNLMKKDDLVIVSKGNSVFRAIGVVTGDYEYIARESGDYCHRRAVRWLWRDPAGVPIDEIYTRGFTMKPVYLLTRADLNIPALERYIASQLPNAGGAPEPFVLIIDEINRANISKVFGELITLLEADKRLGAENELKIRLPYSREMFGVPANLHIIGTMNTADRSIALLDTALRRRFEFRELMPDPTVLEKAGAESGVDLGKMLATFNERIEYLFDREHQIGHAYFMACKSRSDVDAVMRHKVIPLLAEYFYEDWAKVAMVLGDAKGEGCFLERIVLEPPSGLDVDEGAEPRYRWSVRMSFSDNCYVQFQ